MLMVDCERKISPTTCSELSECRGKSISEIINRLVTDQKGDEWWNGNKEVRPNCGLMDTLAI